MEMAALDDPLLADAMEGYAAAGDSWEQPLAELHQQFEQQHQSATPVVAIGKPRSYTWWKAAAAVLLLATTVTLVYLFADRNKNNQIAQQNQQLIDTTISSVAVDSAPSAADVAGNDIAMVEQVKTAKQKERYANQQAAGLPAITSETLAPPTDSMLVYRPAPVDANPSREDLAVSAKPIADDAHATKQIAQQQSGENNTTVSPAPATRRETNITASNEIVSNRNTQYNQYKSTDKDVRKTQGYNLNAPTTNNQLPRLTLQIVNEKKQALPYAQVNTGNGKILFANQQGLLHLANTDVNDEIAVSSAGYQSQKLSFGQQGTAIQQVVLQPAEIVVTQLKSNADRKKSKQALMKAEQEKALQEQEDEEAIAPVIGWTNYNNYLSTNLSLNPSVTDKKLHGDIEIEIRLDKSGNITNATVDKSLCKECDEEAIRLIKEGPKFEVKNKKNRKVKIKVKL